MINRTLAQRYFPRGDAVGHSLKLPTSKTRPPKVLSAPDLADSWLQIVGVVGDALNEQLYENPIKPAVYLPYTLSVVHESQILVKSDVQPLSTAACSPRAVDRREC